MENVDNKNIELTDINKYFITNADELKDNINNKEKHKNYDKLIGFLGCDVFFFKQLRNKPKLIFGEQLGSWLHSVYRQRALILLGIINNEDYGFDKDFSGIYTLYRDRYTTNGQKKIFQIMQLGNLFKPVRLISKKFEEQNKGKIYSSISIESIKDKIRSIFDAVIDIVNLADCDNTDIFKKGLKKVVSIPSTQNGLIAPKDFIDINSIISSDDKLYELFNTIRGIKKDIILKDIEFFKSKLNDHDKWCDYWNDINMKYFNIDKKIDSMDQLFNQFILSIIDVDKLARHLSVITNHNGDKLSLFGIVDDDIYYTVHYDFKCTNDKKFVCYKNNNIEEYKRFTWDEIKQKAKNLETGGPSLILEYIMMACAGMYLFIDYKDAVTMENDDKLIFDIHKKYIGIKYPWITFDLSDKVSNCKEVYPGSYSFLGRYHYLYKDKVFKIMNNFTNNGNGK